MGEIKIMEGFGLPGAGKSTSIAVLKLDNRVPQSVQILLRKDADSKFLDLRYLYVFKSMQIFLEIYNSIAYLVVRPAFLISVFRAMIVFRFGKNFLSVMRKLLATLYSRSKINISQNYNTSILLDEGVVQYIGALAVHSSTDRELPKDLIKYIISNYIKALIYYDVDFDNSIARVRKRNDGKSRFDRMDTDEAILNLTKMRQSFLLCIAVAKDLNIPIIELKNGNSIDDNTKLTLNFLRNLS